MSTAPSAQNVATTSSVRPSSSACVYAAIAARTPSETSANVVIGSEAEVDDRAFERVDVHFAQRREQLLVRKAGKEAVDDSFEVGDAALVALGQPHVFEAPGVQAALLPRQVREILLRDRRP